MPRRQKSQFLFHLQHFSFQLYLLLMGFRLLLKSMFLAFFLSLVNFRVAKLDVSHMTFLFFFVFFPNKT